MNYRKIYNNLMERRKVSPPSGYTERHHIMPRCMGGSDDENNLVALTGREHFISHWLLTKIYDNGSLKQAFGLMCLTGKNRDYKVSSKIYELGKKMISEARFGIPLSDEHKHAISKATKGLLRTEDTKKKMRKPKSKEHIENIAKAKVGSLNPMYGTISPTRDVPHSEETKRLISERTKAACVYPPCPHCGKETTKGNAIRWHYDKCKFKDQ